MNDQPEPDEELRCFIGAFLAPESAERLAQALRLPAGVRRLDRSTWHVTLKFLGSIPAASVPAVLAAVELLGGHSLEATVTGFVGLPRATLARVVAADVAENRPLAEWAAQLAQCFGPADRPFRPHVSVARSSRPIRFPRMELAEPLVIRLEAPALYRSHLNGQGARYERVAEPQAN